MFVTPEYDKHNPERNGDDTILPLWREIIEAFKAWTGEANAEVDRKVKRYKLEAEDLINQAVGCMKSALLRSGRKFIYRNPKELQRRILKWFYRKYSRMIEAMSDKRLKELEHNFIRCAQDIAANMPANFGTQVFRDQFRQKAA